MPVYKQPLQKAFRLSNPARLLLEQLADRMGVTQTAVVELLIREKAKVEGMPIPTAAEVEAAAEKETVAA